MAARKSTKATKSASAARAASTSSTDSATAASPVNNSKKAPSASPAKKTAAAVAVATKKGAAVINMNIKPARYYAQIPLSLRSKAAASKKGLFTKIAESFLGRKAPSPIREFAFMTAAGPQYFCSDKKVTAKFGASHGDRLYYKYGPLAGSYCSVIGVRGGLLWVVNDVSKKGYDGDCTVPARPDFIEKDLSGAFDKGFATPLYGITTGKDLAAAGIEFTVKGGQLNRCTAQVEGFPQPLVDFLKYAPDMSLKIPETNSTMIIPPLLTPTGEIGWSSAGSFASFAPEGVSGPAGEARALVSIVPLLVPTEYLSDDEAEETA